MSADKIQKSYKRIIINSKIYGLSKLNTFLIKTYMHAFSVSATERPLLLMFQNELGHFQRKTYFKLMNLVNNTKKDKSINGE